MGAPPSRPPRPLPPLRVEYLRPSCMPISFVDLIRLLRIKARGDKRQAKLLVLLLRVKNSMYRASRIAKKQKGACAQTPFASIDDARVDDGLLSP